MRPVRMTAAILVFLGLGGCAVVPPTGPNVIAMPGQGKSFEAFQADDAACRQYGFAQTGYVAPGDGATRSAIGSAAIGTVVGAAAGAAIGAAAGNPAAGAAIGAGSGLVVGGAAGASAAQASSASLQQRYDIGYAQCMTAKGDTVQPPPVTYAVYPAYYPYYPYPPFYGRAYFGYGFHHFHHH